MEVLYYWRRIFNHQTSWVNRKKKCAIISLDPEYDVFIVYVAALSVDSGNEGHHLKKAKISHLKVNGAYIKVPSKYADFADIFLPKLAVKFSQYTRINNHAIKLMDD